MSIIGFLGEYPDSAVVPGAKLVAGLDWSARPDLRRVGIGASEAASALGLDDYTGPLALWRRKREGAEPLDLSGVASIRHGHLGEPILLDLLPEVGGPAVAERQVLCARPEWPYLHATCDGVTADGEPVEAKTAGAHTRHGTAIAEAVAAAGAPAIADTSCLPERWLVQAHQQMLMTGAARGHVVVIVWQAAGAHVVVERDEVLVARMLDGLARFWSHVESGVPPEPGAPDLELVRLVRPQVGRVVVLPSACLRDADALAQAEMAVAEAELEIGLLTGAARARKRAAERARDAARARLYHAVGEAEVGLLPDGRRIEAPLRRRKAYDVSAKEYRTLSLRGRVDR